MICKPLQRTIFDQQVLLVLTVGVKRVTLVQQVRVESVGQDSHGLGLLKVDVGIEIHRLDHRSVKCLWLLPEDLTRRNYAVRVCSQELQHPEVLRTVGCPRL